MKAIGILIDPHGEEWFDAYGPMTKDRSKATVFASAAVASRAAEVRFGRAGLAFWNSEREAEAHARKQYSRWTHRAEEVPE